MEGQFVILVLASILILSISIPEDAFAAIITQTQKVFPDGEFIDDFGISVSIDGNTAVVGAVSDELEDPPGTFFNTGAAYIYEKNSGGNWIQVQMIRPSGSPDEAQFGNSVAISGDTIVVGAHFEGNFQPGAAYIFEKTGGVWPPTETKRILASDIVTGDNFGTSVDISVNTVIVGSFSSNAGIGFGAAYIFEKGAGGWPATETKKILPSDGAFDFGASVSIDDNIVVVGASFGVGSAYIFEKGGSWPSTETKIIIASDRAENDNFGVSVSISGDTVIVGADFEDVNGSASGSAYIFEKTGGVWPATETKKIFASDGTGSVNFGTSVSISGNIAIAGAPTADGISGFQDGVVYVFEKNAGVWPMTETHKLQGSTETEGDDFGSSVSISGGNVIVGLPDDDILITDNDDILIIDNDGSAYFFELESGPVPLILTLKSSVETVLPDDTFTYTYMITNPLDGEERAAAISSVLSGPGKYVSVEQTGDTLSIDCEDKLPGNPLDCSWDTIVPGETKTVTVTVKVDHEAATGEEFENRLCGDPNPPLCFIDELILNSPSIPAAADMRLEVISLSVLEVARDETFTYEFTVVNHDPHEMDNLLNLEWADAQNAKLTVDIPDLGTFEGGLTDGGTCEVIGVDKKQIICTWDKITIVERSKTATISVNVNDDAEDGKVFKPTPKITSDTLDPFESNNIPFSPIEDPIVVLDDADLEIILGVNKDPVGPGKSFTYSFEVTNSEDSLFDATNVLLTFGFEGPGIITEILNLGLAMCQGSDSGAIDPEIMCQWDTIAIDDTESITLTVLVNEDALGEIFIVDASVKGENFDPNLDDNSILPRIAPTVDEIVDLETAFTLVDETDPVSPGETFTYSIDVTNSNDGTIDTEAIVDLFFDFTGPGTITSFFFVNPNPPFPNTVCEIVDIEKQSLRCNWDNIVLGETKSGTVSILVNDDASNDDVFMTTAKVVCLTCPDPDLDNNESSLNAPTVTRDNDGDGIFDDVDPLPTTPSNDFSDGTTFGTITLGNAVLEISDNPSNGIHISSTGFATVDACGNSSYLFSAGSTLNISCGSVTIEIVSGSVDVEFVVDGGTIATTTLIEGNIVTFEQDTLLLTNNGFVPVTLIVNGEEQTILPGEFVTLITEIIIDIIIDIKPGSEENPVNLKSKGVIPVAVLSTDSFDATTLDVRTMTFGPNSATESHNKLHIEDVNGDGLDDVVLHFKIQDIGLDEDTTSLDLSGQTVDGVSVKGTGDVIIKGSKIKEN